MLHILPTDNHTFQHITTHQPHPYHPNSSSAIYSTPHQQPQILSVTTLNPSRPTALPLQPEHLNRKFPPYATCHPSDSHFQPTLLPANNATEPYYVATPPL